MFTVFEESGSFPANSAQALLIPPRYFRELRLEMGIASPAAWITSPENFSIAGFRLESSGGAERYLEINVEDLSQLALRNGQVRTWMGCRFTEMPSFVLIM